jgi:LemA protein
MAVIVPFALATIGVVCPLWIYCRLVRARDRAREAWFDIEMQLRRRSTLIPNLVETVRGHARHEHEIFAEVTRARGALAKAAEPLAASAADGSLTHALSRLISMAESHPQVRAVSSFHLLRRQLSETEQKIASARQFYNRTAAAYNAAIHSFPGSLFARRYHFDPVSLFDPRPPFERDVKVISTAA